MPTVTPRKVLATVACLGLLAAAAAVWMAPRAAAQAGAAPDERPGPAAAYTVSFRIITARVAEGYDPALYADLADGGLCFAPPDADGFYDQAKLRETYGPAIREGLEANVWPVYTLCMRPNADPVTIRGVMADGEREWGMSCFLEPSVDDLTRVALHSQWDLQEVLGFGVGDYGRSDHMLGVPLNLHGGGSATSGPDGEVAGSAFVEADVVLVLIEEVKE
jgi:hypothetical protein